MSDAEDYSRLAFFANALVSAAIWAPEEISAITDFFVEPNLNTIGAITDFFIEPDLGTVPTSTKVNEVAVLLGKTLARETPGSENVRGALLRCADILGNRHDEPGRFASATLRWAIRAHRDSLEGT
jgi:hypothetical protein